MDRGTPAGVNRADGTAGADEHLLSRGEISVGLKLEEHKILNREKATHCAHNLRRKVPPTKLTQKERRG
jgi:hypothetical protein